VGGDLGGTALRTLLDRARSQDEDAAERALLERAVATLVPDEALVLERLSMLGRVPVVDIWTRPHTGGPGEAVLTNASRVGRLAGVALPDLVPTYLTRLEQLGLVALEPGGDDLTEHTHELLAEPLVLRALARANGDGTTPRVVRRVVRLTALGARLVAETGLPEQIQVESSTDEP
jgi:hypothetical protein